MNDSFVCEICKKEYLKGRSEEECNQEMRDNFGEECNGDDCGLVCDDCYKKMTRPYIWKVL